MPCQFHVSSTPARLPEMGIICSVGLETAGPEFHQDQQVQTAAELCSVDRPAFPGPLAFGHPPVRSGPGPPHRLRDDAHGDGPSERSSPSRAETRAAFSNGVPDKPGFVDGEGRFANATGTTLVVHAVARAEEHTRVGSEIANVVRVLGRVPGPGASRDHLAQSGPWAY